VEVASVGVYLVIENLQLFGPMRTGTMTVRVVGSILFCVHTCFSLAQSRVPLPSVFVLAVQSRIVELHLRIDAHSSSIYKSFPERHARRFMLSDATFSRSF